jgi:hypothetical protein
MGKGVKAENYPIPKYELIPIEGVKLHEEVVPARVDEVADDILKRGVVLEPIVVDDKHHIVLNGHHRLAALQKLGAKRIPAYLVPYDAPYITVDRWPDSTWYKRTVTKKDVLEAGLSQRLMTPHTSRHKFLIHLEQIRTPIEKLM